MKLDSSTCLAVARVAGTPCFILFPELLERLTSTLVAGPRTRSRVQLAYPIKTMPLAYWLRAWRRLAKYAEAASEGELRLALKCGFSPSRIIVNGPGKATWMRAHRLRNLTVVFDSMHEVRVLGPVAKHLGWRVGLRFAPLNQVDPDNSREVDQFGMDADGFSLAARALRDLGVEVTLLHFHLGGAHADVRRALDTLNALGRLVRDCGLAPARVDIGGGFVQAFQASDAISVARRCARSLQVLDREVRRTIPSCREVIAEYGRVLLGPAAALLLRVTDVKVKYGKRFVVCDGGRVNHALPSDWERHRLYFPDHADGESAVRATVCGPTCMAWDYLDRLGVPIGIAPGDFVVYDAAGAYHWPWQSSFSNGRAALVSVRGSSSGKALVRRLMRAQSPSQWLALSGA